MFLNKSPRRYGDRHNTDRHVSIGLLYPSSFVLDMPFSESQGEECFEIHLRIHGLLALFTFFYSANI